VITQLEESCKRVKVRSRLSVIAAKLIYYVFDISNRSAKSEYTFLRLAVSEM
jgi:hypothetical protein